MQHNTSSVPSLFIKQVWEQSTKLELRLTIAARKCIVRFTGGCAYMSSADALGLYELFLTDSFNRFSQQTSWL